MDDTLLIRFLYTTKIGRVILKLLVGRNVSRFVGMFLNSRFSKFIIPHYIKKNNIDMSDIEIPKKGFKSFNSFFTRKKKSGKEYELKGIINPCDGFLSCIKIKKNTIFDIKHTKFSLEDLLQDKALAKAYEDGIALIYRLTPANYHRYCYATEGKIVFNKKIPGKLYCVRPIVTKSMPVFVQNAREYQVIDTDDYGKIIQMEVGATLVGKISNHDKFKVNSKVKIGEEKGFFEFGGSTIIVLLQKDKVELKENILYSVKNKENEVKIYDVITGK